MPRTIITNCRVIADLGILEGCSVALENRTISSIFPAEKQLILPGDMVVDGDGDYLSPGYIDLHIHGLHRYKVDSGAEDVRAMAGLLPRYGVTGFLPTVLPRPKGPDAAFIASMSQLRPEGAEILGFHLEGPFLALPGAIPPEALGKADPDRVTGLIEAALPYLAIFSVSPDFEGILDLIPIMAANGVPVFITHTRASVEQTLEAIEAGARHATHFFDVFPLPAERDPGVRPCGAVEALLADPRVTVDFILDGEHVHPIAVKLAMKCKGTSGVCLITDSNLGAGLPPGERYCFAGYNVLHHYEGGPARMAEDSPLPGALAGSGLTMDRAVRNAIKMLGIDLPAATRMASSNPAGVLGLAGRKGKIAPGYDADVLLLDSELNVRQTWVSGRCCFCA
jgi:N-acetylglucosamine-6-phosphate deacetylase